MRRMKVKELVAEAHAAVAELPPAQGQLMREIASRLDVTFVALTEALEASKQDAAKWFKAFEKAVSVGARYEEQIAELVAGRLNLQRTMGVYIHAYEEAKEQIAKDVEIKARLCRESNSLFDRLRATEKRIAELEPFRTAYMEWSDKTDWVRTDRRFDVVKPLGKHLADVLKAYIEHLESRTVTVKLPEPFKLAKSSSGLTYYYADEIDKALADAGINVEVE